MLTYSVQLYVCVQGTDSPVTICHVFKLCLTMCYVFTPVEDIKKKRPSSGIGEGRVFSREPDFKVYKNSTVSLELVTLLRSTNQRIQLYVRSRKGAASTGLRTQEKYLCLIILSIPCHPMSCISRSCYINRRYFSQEQLWSYAVRFKLCLSFLYGVSLIVV